MTSLRSPVTVSAALALGVVVACAGASPTTQPAPTRNASNSATADAREASAADAVPPPRVDAGAVVGPCPTSLVEAVTRPAAACQTRGKTCTYEAPKGSCACTLTQAAQCGGDEMPHIDYLAWQCQLAHPEKTTRADGCPLLPPQDGAACAGATACSWSAQGACGRDRIGAACKGGRWHVETLFGTEPLERA
jgi:hypothetical protein